LLFVYVKENYAYCKALKILHEKRLPIFSANQIQLTHSFSTTSIMSAISKAVSLFQVGSKL